MKMIITTLIWIAVSLFLLGLLQNKAEQLSKEREANEEYLAVKDRIIARLEADLVNAKLQPQDNGSTATAGRGGTKAPDLSKGKYEYAITYIINHGMPKGGFGSGSRGGGEGGAGGMLYPQTLTTIVKADSGTEAVQKLVDTNSQLIEVKEIQKL